MSGLLWRHKNAPQCVPFDARTWWLTKPIVWQLAGEVLEQRPCPGCGSHISSECLEPVVINDDGTVRGATR